MAQITTIIPTYRRPILLKRAVRSVLAQTYPDILVCIYDNASGDHTAEVVHDLAQEDERVRYCRNSENIGWLKNFAKGMSEVSTPYFHLLSDDDVILPHFFERAMSAISRYPEVGAFAGATVRLGHRFVEADGTGRRTKMAKSGLIGHSMPQDTSAPGSHYNPPDGLAAMLVHGRPEWTGMIFKTRAPGIEAGLDESLAEACDAEFVYRAAANNAVFLTHAPCAAFSLHEGSQSHALWSPSHTVALRLKVMAKLDEEFGGDKNIRDALTVARSWIGHRLVIETWSAIELGRVAQALDAADCLEQEFGLKVAARLLRLGVSVSQSKIGDPLILAERALRRVRREIRLALSRYRLRNSWPEIERALALS